MTVAERFWAKVDKSGDCWFWTGSTNGRGYGAFKLNGRPIRVHRWAYQQIIGPIPEGMQLDHLCRNRLCVNPAHMEPVTNRENSLRGVGPTAVNAKRTHCVNGHPLSGENLRLAPNGRWRVCRRCEKEKERRRLNAKRGTHAENHHVG